MSDYNPTNPAFDALLNIENVLKNMKPKELETESTKGMLSRRTPTVEEAKKDGRMQIAKYVKILRDIRQENKKS
tara:strand:- start:296 stop:517 length:222 start_codon:yes stop_codon:yes gene_type:complete